MIIALIIIAVLAFFFLSFRAYACFNLIVIGVGMLIAGLMSGESLFTTGGFVILVIGVVILYLTSLGVEKSMRFEHMKRMFLYGMYLFLKVICIMLIIGIPFAKVFSAMAANYREMIVVDSEGRDTGKRVTVREDTMTDPTGKEKYKKYDPYE